MDRQTLWYLLPGLAELTLSKNCFNMTQQKYNRPLITKNYNEYVVLLVTEYSPTRRKHD